MMVADPTQEGTHMCRPVPCETCGKTTWYGCGDHVDQVRAMVRPEDWCPGHPEDVPTQTWENPFADRS